MYQARISVVLCSYNGGAFIDEQLASIIEQSHQPAEIIIKDDCSTDDTWEKLLKWQERSPLIKLYRNSNNLGYNKNFKEAMELATGDFIAISDQDDIWLPDKLEKQIQSFKDEDVVLSHNRSVRLRDGQLDVGKSRLQYHFSGKDTRRLFIFNQINGHDMLFRRSLLAHALPIPDGMFYDWWIAVVATCYGSIASVDEFLVHHRIHGQNSYFSKTSGSKKKELDLDASLRLFSTISALRPSDRKYLEALIQLLDKKIEKPGFSFPLFLFFFRNRKVIFGHKRRSFPELSYLKNSLKHAAIDFRGKGASF